MGKFVCFMLLGFVIIVGMDIFDVVFYYIWDVFNKFGVYDVVFGFVVDGGYWFVGFKCVCLILYLFENVCWLMEYVF